MGAPDELEAAVSGWVADRTVDEATEALTAAGIPVGPVAGIADAVASAQIAAREMLVEVDHPTLGAGDPDRGAGQAQRDAGGRP